MRSSGGQPRFDPAAATSTLRSTEQAGSPRPPSPADQIPLRPRKIASPASQAIVVVDPVQHLLDHASPPALPQGWSWIFTNASLPSLLNCLFLEADLLWSALLLPGERIAPDAVFGCSFKPRPVLLPYAQHAQLPSCLIPRDHSQGSRSHFVIINGHQFPLCNLAEAIRLHRRNRCDATIIGLRPTPAQQYDEQLLLDPDGHVRGVTRIYNQHHDIIGHEQSWPAVMILSSQAMMRLADQPLPPRLNLWPGAMLRAGLRLRGQVLPGQCFDLHTPHQLEELGHLLLHTRPHWITDVGQLTEHAPRIWVGSGVSIAPSAHLVAPIAIGDDVTIGSEAVIVGPAMIGRGTRVEPGAHLRRCLLLPDTPGKPQTPAASLATGPPNHRSIQLQNVLDTGTIQPLRGLRSRAYQLTKRAIDMAGATLFLAMTLPCYLLIALAIKINSPGPVFYGHVRQGKGGRNFTCWKFRTMVPESDRIKQHLLASNEVDGPQFKMSQDPRIFRVGQILRRFNIDEWPQFYNVLRGDMSLVGPRPSPESENQMCPAWREARLSVRPGITGLWQVCRRREEDTDFQEWIYYDVQYVKQQSLWLDLKILLWTLRVAFKGR